MDKIKIGRYLCRLRTEKGYLQTDLAEILSVSPQAVSKWECGESLPDIQTLLELSKLYQININEILEVGEIKETGELKETDNKKVNKNGIFDILFGSLYIFFNIIIGFFPILISREYSISINLYNIIFSNNFLVGNYVFMLVVVLSLSLGVILIISGALKISNNYILKIERAISITTNLILLNLLIIYIDQLSFGGYLFLLINIITFILLISLKNKKINRECVDYKFDSLISTIVYGLAFHIICLSLNTSISVVYGVLITLFIIGCAFVYYFVDNRIWFKIIRIVVVLMNMVYLCLTAFLNINFTNYIFVIYFIVVCLGFFIYLLVSKKERIHKNKTNF